MWLVSPLFSWFCSDLIIQQRQRIPVIVLRLRVHNLSLRLLQLRLAEFHNGTESEGIAGLGEVESEVGGVEQLFGDIHAIECSVGVEPTGAYVTGDAGAQVNQTAALGLRAQIGFVFA